MDRIGNSGIAKFGDNRKIVMGTVSLLALLILLLIIVAMAGWSTDGKSLQKIAWGSFAGSGITSYAGLQGVYVDAGTFYLFSDTTCTTSLSFCDNCKTAGQAALGLYLISFFIMIGVILASFIRMFKDNNLLKICALVLTFLVWIFTVAGFGNWNQKCYMNLPNKSGYVLSYFAGYGAAVCAWFFSTFLFIFHLLTPVTTFEDSQASTASADVSKA